MKAWFFALGVELPPGPTSFPRRDLFLLGALGIVLLVLGIVMVLVVRRHGAAEDEGLYTDETLEGP